MYNFVFESRFNLIAFSDGQTGCGKTHTMQGPPNDPGIIPLSFEHVFEAIASADDSCQFLVRASYIEIYNEVELHCIINITSYQHCIQEVRDLLGDDPKKPLQLKQDPKLGVYVKVKCTHE